MLRLLRNTSISLWLIASLIATTVSLSLWAASMTAQIASLTATISANAIAHRKALASSTARLKAKARLQRLIAAVPIAGIASLAYFEEQDFQEWLAENPQGTRSDYACEVAAITADVLDEVLQELPESARPRPQTVQVAFDGLVNCEG